MRDSFTLHAICYNLLFLVASSINTVWLMPKYFIEKRYKIYFPAFIVLLLCFAVIMGSYNNWIVHRFPGVDENDFTAIGIGLKGSGLSWIDYYFSILPSLFFLLFTFAIGYLTQQYFQVRRQQEIIGKKQTESELSLLKSQINPHFLFNVLNSIYALSLKKSDKTPEIVLKLSDILRYMLYETKQEKVSLEKEIDMIENYIEIEKIRIGSLQQISLEIKGAFDSYIIAPVILIPFVENAVKHGLDSMSENAFVNIQIEVEQSILKFYCSNNFKENTVKRPGGIGLENVRKRLQLLYAHKHSLHIKNENAIFTVTLNLTLN
jgi:LytS/YehU family sensor histidine kinase